MKLLDKYIAKQFFATYLFASISFTALFLLINLIENLDEFIDNTPPGADLFGYYLSLVPETVLLTSPLSTLLASLFVTGRLSASSELPAMKAAGAALNQIMRPFAGAALLVTLFNVLNAGWLSPHAAVTKNRFEASYFNKKFDDLFDDAQIRILESRNRILSIGTLDKKAMRGLDVSLETFEGTIMTRRIDAESISYDTTSGRWIFHRTQTRTFEGDGFSFRENPGRDTLKLSLKPSSFKDLAARPDEMNLLQHAHYIEEKKSAGFSNLGKAVVNFHSKIALPAASLIIVFIGVPLSARKKRSGLALETGISLFIGFIYLGLEKTLSTLGYRNLIDPALAAWLPNLLFLGVGALIYRNTGT